MADREYILSPIHMMMTFRMEQVSMLVNSLHLIGMSDHNSGFDQWIYETWDALTPDEQLNHKVVMDVAHDEQISFFDAPTFPHYIDLIKDVPTEQLAQSSIEWMNHHEQLPSPEDATRDEDTYIDVMRGWYAYKKETKGKEHPFDEAQWRLMYRYLQAPQDLHALVISHLTMMWDRFLKTEWLKRKTMLAEAAQAYSQMDYAGLSPYEVIEAVTGRDMRDSDHFNKFVKKNKELIFVPSPHVGPYIGFGGDGSKTTAWIFFGARLPKGSSVKSTALGRSELLVRLNALADDIRLRMLELLIEHEELCAQDFINLLDLSQSSASRHLRQLTACGYLTERRKEVAKCYSLNADRIEDTLSALRQFLVNET